MNRILFSLIVLHLAFQPAFSQEAQSRKLSSDNEEAISWINKNAYELKSDPDLDDLSFLARELTDKTVVGLGEASHGTHEFYVQKARIIKYLIRKADFKLLSFESPQTMLVPINTYLQNGEGNLKELMRGMALYSTQEIYQLFQWIREYNTGKPSSDQVVLIGFDSEDYWGDPFSRDKFMAANLVRSYEAKNSKTIVWTHNVHMVKDTTSKYQAMAYYLKQQFGDQFYAVGFDTYQGTVNVLNDGVFEPHTFQANESSFSRTLAQAKYTSFFLPFDDKSPFTGLTSMITNIYSNWQEFKPLPVRPGVDFDGMVFIRSSSASVQLKQ